MNGPKYKYFNGVKFTRDDETGYYLNSTLRKRMHRYVWEYYHGKIPKFFQIHHIDGDRSNNDISNLEMIRVGEHQRLHGEKLSETERQMRRDNMAENARPAAIAWHKSEAGREWHRIHGIETMKTREQVEKTCEYCGKAYKTIQKASRFCSNKCRAANRRKTEADAVIKTCEICGKEFVTNKYSGTFTCSRACANVYMHKMKGHKIAEDKEAVCIICGNKFTYHGRREKKTCSRTCSAKLAYMNRNE